MLITDIITGGFGIVQKLIEVHKLDEWFRLLFGFGFTFVSVFAVTTGSALVGLPPYNGPQRPAVAIGYGLISAGGAIWSLFIMNPRTRKIMVAWPKSIEPSVSDYQTTEKTK